MNEPIMKVGICGLGFVGNAIQDFMSKVLDVLVYDKYKQINSLETLLSADLIYICIPTPYSDDLKTYDMCELDTTLALLAEKHYKGIILIKSTVLPDYCAEKNTIYPQLRVIHNPEFLSASTAVEDFANQVQIILGYTSQSQACVNNISEFYGKLFPSAILSVTTSTVAGLAKLACNSFYATKVQFFTDLFFLCEKKQIEFNEVKKLMLNNQWIHERHTTVPGPDGRVSFGGACLPKDISALNQYMIQKKSPNNVLDAVINERNSMRND